MMSHRSFIKTLACLVVLGASTIGGTNVATAEVVFGNLGLSGTAALSSSGSDMAGIYSAAVGFTTGSSNDTLKLDSIRLGLFYDNVATQSFTLKVYENNGGKPGALAFTSSPSLIAAKNRYSFSFGQQQMTASTTYWIVPDESLFWYGPSPASAPVAFNASGYVSAGTVASSDSRVTWTATPEINFYSVSVQAVPEPSTYAMAAIGAGVAGLMGWRRRKVAADAAPAV
ncbi:MAG: choice-of-anchor R domain-containing protein [Planctomycetaceae bacterium]